MRIKVQLTLDSQSVGAPIELTLETVGQQGRVFARAEDVGMVGSLGAVLEVVEPPAVQGPHRVCSGREASPPDGRCIDCDLPMERHPVTFTRPFAPANG